MNENMMRTHGVSVVLYTSHYATIAENYVLLSRMLKLPVSTYI